MMMMVISHDAVYSDDGVKYARAHHSHLVPTLVITAHSSPLFPVPWLVESANIFLLSLFVNHHHYRSSFSLGTSTIKMTLLSSITITNMSMSVKRRSISQASAVCQLTCSPSDNLTIWKSDNLTIWQSDNLTIWPSDNLTIWQSENHLIRSPFVISCQTLQRVNPDPCTLLKLQRWGWFWSLAVNMLMVIGSMSWGVRARKNGK